MMSDRQYCECVLADSEVLCKLPITLPTSKVRVKRITRKNNIEEIEPVPPRSEILTVNDYIEWQISYAFDNNLIEFGLILKEFYTNGYLKEDEICNIFRKIGNMPTFEENYRIQRNMKDFSQLDEFVLIYEKTPILRLPMHDGSFIDIVLRHKQRAVGYQAMVYIYIPINSESLKPVKPLLGRKAFRGETVLWYPRKEHVSGLLKAFLIASLKHRMDIENILMNNLSIKC